MKAALLIAVVALVAGTVAISASGHRAAPKCAPTLAGALSSTAGASQLITVQAASHRSTTAEVRLWQKRGDCWRLAAGPWHGHIGSAGISTHHREGDNTTPAGIYGFEHAMYGIDANPGVRYRYRQLVCGDWWDGDSSSPTYNTFRHLPCGAKPPFGGNSEALWAAVATYGSLAVLDYNTNPAVPGRGSAMFLHISDGLATHGCVSLPKRNLLQALRWMRPSHSPHIVIGVKGRMSAF